MANINLTGSIGVQGSVAVLGNYAVVFASDANHTMSAAEYSNKFLEVTSSGSLTATRNLVAPLNQGQEYTVQNKTTGSQSIQIIGNTGTGVTVASGQTVSVTCDGTNYLSAVAAGLTVTQVALSPSSPGNFTVAHGVGTTPSAVSIQMTSSGQIWFQTSPYDGTNLYLVASDSGLTGSAAVWS